MLGGAECHLEHQCCAIYGFTKDKPFNTLIFLYLHVQPTGRVPVANNPVGARVQWMIASIYCIGDGSVPTAQE